MPIPLPWTLGSVVAVWLAAGLLAVLGRSRPRRDPGAGRFLALFGLVFAATATVYLANARRLTHLDSQPPAWTAVSLVRSGDFTLDEFRPAVDPIIVQCITTPRGRIVSMYPPGSALALVPFLLPLRLAGAPLTLELLDAAVKLAAATWTALSAVLLLAALRRYASEGAWLATVAYAFGTTAFSSAAQDLWQHGPSQAGLAAALLLLTFPRPGPRHEVALGAALGWAVLCRTSNLLPVFVLFAAGARSGWRAGLRIAAGGLPFALFTLAYNQATTGSPWLFAHTVHHGGMGFGQSLPAGLAALLFEPSRGLFVYSPFLLLAAVGAFRELARVLRRSPLGRPVEPPPAAVPMALVGAVAAIPLLLLVAQWEEWHGGWSYGYRIISEVALLLSPAFAKVVAARRGRPRALAGVGGLVALSVAIHSLHVFAPENAWNAAHLHGTAFHGMWSADPRDWQITWHLRAALGRRE